MSDLKKMFEEFDKLPAENQEAILANPKGFRAADFSPIDPDESPTVAALRAMLAERGK